MTMSIPKGEQGMFVKKTAVERDGCLLGTSGLFCSVTLDYHPDTKLAFLSIIIEGNFHDSDKIGFSQLTEP